MYLPVAEIKPLKYGFFLIEERSHDNLAINVHI